MHGFAIKIQVIEFDNTDTCNWLHLFGYSSFLGGSISESARFWIFAGCRIYWKSVIFVNAL